MPETKKDPVVVVVTGAASGMGRATALLACERGWRVVAFDQDTDGLSTTVNLTERFADSQVHAFAGDVSSESDVEQCFAIAGELGVVTGVVAAAGVLHFKLLHEASTEDLRKVWDVNLLGTALTCKYALRSFLKSETEGAICCISSPQALSVAPGGNAAYAASKGGVNALIRAVAVDYASKRIRINGVIPGATETPMMWVDVPEQKIDKTRELLCTEIPLRRLGRPEDVAAAALWLLSEEAGYTTGSLLSCEGGMLAKSSISL